MKIRLTHTYYSSGATDTAPGHEGTLQIITAHNHRGHNRCTKTYKMKQNMTLGNLERRKPPNFQEQFWFAQEIMISWSISWIGMDTARFLLVIYFHLATFQFMFPFLSCNSLSSLECITKQFGLLLNKIIVQMFVWLLIMHHKIGIPFIYVSFSFMYFTQFFGMYYYKAVQFAAKKDNSTNVCLISFIKIYVWGDDMGSYEVKDKLMVMF